jgi:hypothetical protein
MPGFAEGDSSRSPHRGVKQQIHRGPSAKVGMKRSFLMTL